MAEVPPNKNDLAQQLANQRALARIQQTKQPPAPRSRYAPSLPISSTLPTRGADYEGVRDQSRNDYQNRLGDSQTGGAPLNAAEQRAVAGRLQADRIRAARAQQIEDEKRQAAKKAKQGGGDKDYPYPISFRKFVAFGLVAVAQDLVPLLFDLLAIGWIVEYCLLPITWGAYWLLIVRWTPRSLRKKFWQRTILVTAAGWIPVLGQFLPEWTATAIGAYIVISLYERRKANLAAGKRRDALKAGTGETGAAAPAVAAPAPALAGAGSTAASAAQTLPR